MPLPLLLGAVAVVSAVGGIGTGVHGGVKMKKASDSMKEAQEIQKKALNRVKTKNAKASALMDDIGETELKILESFKNYIDVRERILNNPDYTTCYDKNDEENMNPLPEYEPEKIKEISAAATAILSGLSGAAAGTAGGIAAAGATTVAVTALGTASTGTAIASLTGAAATNAALAALGGGAIAAGGGGVALGTTILGASTLGVGFLVGGVIFNISGSKLSKKADEAYEQANEIKKEANKSVNYLDKLSRSAKKFFSELKETKECFDDHLDRLDALTSQKTDWNDFSFDEQDLAEDTFFLFDALNKMCNTKLVLENENKNGFKEVNDSEITEACSYAKGIRDQATKNN